MTPEEVAYDYKFRLQDDLDELKRISKRLGELAKTETDAPVAIYFAYRSADVAKQIEEIEKELRGLE